MPITSKNPVRSWDLNLNDSNVECKCTFYKCLGMRQVKVCKWCHSLLLCQEYLIKNTWDGDDIKSHDPVKLILSANVDGKYLVVKVDAPFFNDPGMPSAPAGKPCAQLWDYEGLGTFAL